MPKKLITIDNLLHYDKIMAYLDKEEADKYYLPVDGHITLTEEQKAELKGQDGKDGKDGTDAFYFTPFISEEGVLTWTNNGNMENPAPINIKGLKGEDGVYKGVVRHVMAETDTEVELAANEVYTFPEMATLTVTLGPATDMFDEYHFFFDSGETATTLSLPAGLSLPDDFEVEANKRYEISIAEDILLYTSRDLEVTV